MNKKDSIEIINNGDQPIYVGNDGIEICAGETIKIDPIIVKPGQIWMHKTSGWIILLTMETFLQDGRYYFDCDEAYDDEWYLYLLSPIRKEKLIENYEYIGEL